MIEAFILAGGGSVRFGRDKARAKVDGAPLVTYVARALHQRYDRVRVVSAPGRSYDDLGLDTVFDSRPDEGPLAGIEAALLAADSQLVAIAPCDVLGLDASWYGPLEAAAGDSAAALFDERWHPLIGVYHRDLLPTIQGRLSAGKRAVRSLLDEVGVKVFVPDNFPQLRSINRIEDLP